MQRMGVLLGLQAVESRRFGVLKAALTKLGKKYDLCDELEVFLDKRYRIYGQRYRRMKRMGFNCGRKRMRQTAFVSKILGDL